MGGDALDVARARVGWTALFDSMDDVDTGEPSRSAMVVEDGLAGRVASVSLQSRAVTRKGGRRSHGR